MRLEVLIRTHDGHGDIPKCRERAKQSVWWTSTSEQIQDMIKCGRICNEHKQNSIASLIPTLFPNRLAQTMVLDLFKLKSVDYLIVVD